MKTLLLLVVLLLALSGLCEWIHQLRLLAVSGKRPHRTVLVVWLWPGTALSQLRTVNEQMRWNGSQLAEQAVAVDDEIRDEEWRECRDFAAQNGITFCPSSVLCQVTETLITEE